MKIIFPPEIIEDTTETLFVWRSRGGYVIYTVVVLAVAAVLASLPFIYVEISTQARGIIRTPNENNQIQAAVYGEVMLVNMSENQQVKKGDTLLVLNTDVIAEQIRQKETKISQNQDFIEDINALLSRSTAALRTPKYITEKGYFQSAQNEQKNLIAYLKKEYEISSQLLEKEAIARQEFMKAETDYRTAQNQQNNLRQQFFNRWKAEKTAYEIENSDLQSSVNQLVEEKTKYILRAPASGAIIQFAGIQAGNFIAPAQTIAQISTNDDLLVECYVSPADIGYIKENQQVAFQLDAFNYNQWGLAHGTVREISRDIVTIENRPVFRVRCTLKNRYLSLKNGYTGNLKKGMTLTGRFRLTDRTLWQLLFDKVDNWINPKIEKQ